MQLKIILCDPQNKVDEYELLFQLNDSNIAKRWANKLLEAQSKYNIDDPQRFYGFGSFEEESNKALKFINNCINIINNDKKIIDRTLKSIKDTDTLNYLHHIFEIYHGLLDKQDHDFWLSAKSETKNALANLNIAVHRVENVLYGNKQRFTITYFGLPKNDFLNDDDYEYYINKINFGDLTLNYVEIGKTLVDLWRDNDEYIEPKAFQPFQRFSADFTVKFYDEEQYNLDQITANCIDYYNRNYKLFLNLGYKKLEKKLLPGYFQIGKLIYVDKNEILLNVKNHQMVKSVILL